jgi:integrase
MYPVHFDCAGLRVAVPQSTIGLWIKLWVMAESSSPVKLTATGLKRLGLGMYGDGDGLWLRVVTPERRSWLFRYQRQGKAHEMGLGSFPAVSLAEAREKVQAARKLLSNGIDPLDQRRAERQAAEAEEARATTFGEAAAAYIAAHEAGWRNAKHAAQWRSTLATYAEPMIGAMACGAIETADILKVLQPIWTKKPETATRLRGRLEMILSYAAVRGWREGPNPAVWRGHLQLMLPARGKVAPVVHHAALDWREAPAFMAKLRAREGMGARALEFAILTGARSGEVRGAEWAEIDLDRAEWIIPAKRMKAKRAHRVPLSEPALALLREQAKLKDGSGLVFFGQRRGVIMSDMTLTAVLRRMGRGELTAHGFRSTFRDWAAETTGHPNHVVEAAIAHAISDKVEAAYRRGDLFEKRAVLMDDWAAFLGRQPAEVVPLTGRRGAHAEVPG